MIKLILGGLIGAALFASVVKAEDKAITPQEFVNSVVAVPGKVVNHINREIEKTKAYQAKSWAESKDQFQRTIDQIKGLFTKTK